jgi:hypothetical protein
LSTAGTPSTTSTKVLCTSTKLKFCQVARMLQPQRCFHEHKTFNKNHSFKFKTRNQSWSRLIPVQPWTDWHGQDFRCCHWLLRIRHRFALCLPAKKRLKIQSDSILSWFFYSLLFSLSLVTSTNCSD